MHYISLVSPDGMDTFLTLNTMRMAKFTTDGFVQVWYNSAGPLVFNYPSREGFLKAIANAKSARRRFSEPTLTNEIRPRFALIAEQNGDASLINVDAVAAVISQSGGSTAGSFTPVWQAWTGSADLPVNITPAEPVDWEKVLTKYHLYTPFLA